MSASPLDYLTYHQKIALVGTALALAAVLVFIGLQMGGTGAPPINQPPTDVPPVTPTTPS